jgi:hypothetical protein
MPIYVQVPGGKMDTTGRGAAAAQGFRLNEREADRRDMAFQTEREVALRKVEMDEQVLDFEKEQLAQQQGAAADVLMGMALQGGAKFGTPQEQAAFHAALSKTHLRFQGQMAETLARSARLNAEQAKVDSILRELPNTPETESRVKSGELTDPDAIERAMAKERGQIARTADQEESRLGAREQWMTIQKEPGFVMPDQTMDADAHSSAMEILSELYDGSATQPNVDYRALTHELEILTNPNKLKAARAALQRAMGGVDIRGNPKLLGNALDSAQFRGQVEGVAADQQSNAARAGRNADDPNYEARKAKAKAGGAAAKPAAAGGKPSARLTEPVPDRLAGVETKGDLEVQVQQALHDYGFKEAPKPGTPEHRIYLRIIEQVTEKLRAAKAAEKKGASDGSAGYEGATFSQ